MSSSSEPITRAHTARSVARHHACEQETERRNDAGECNSANLILIGAEEGGDGETELRDQLGWRADVTLHGIGERPLPDESVELRILFSSKDYAGGTHQLGIGPRRSESVLPQQIGAVVKNSGIDKPGNGEPPAVKNSSLQRRPVRPGPATPGSLKAPRPLQARRWRLR